MKQDINQEVLENFRELLFKKEALEIAISAKQKELIDIYSDERRRTWKRRQATKKAITATKRSKTKEELKIALNNYVYEIEQNKSRVNIPKVEARETPSLAEYATSGEQASSDN